MRRIGPLLLLAVFAGCAPQAPVVRHATPFPSSIALLPLNNYSNNMQGPVLVRKLVEMRLIGSGFDPMDTKEVDTRLNGIGITDGGQLGAIQPQKLGETLGAEALLYGEVLRFAYTNVGVYSTRVVEVRLILVDAATGKRLWECTKKETTTKLGLSADGIKENLVTGLGAKLIETALKSPLRPETETVVQGLMKDFNRTRRNW